MGSEAGGKTFTSPCIKNTPPDPELPQEKCIVTREEVLRFVKDIFLVLGAPPETAQQVGEKVVDADLRGHYTHGMNRLGKLLLKSSYMRS